ncbi:M20/M25/M40 family metallo-hydrolase [Microbacterium sp. X-17]|uniref:M20/M25/M40 family metallo-hydrolase n=1 Tax=Microbacterium sp. X-17 TaxID=3144404 RepID=UPI0031F49C15
MLPENAREDAVRAAALAATPHALAELGQLVRIPSIAFPGFDADEVRRSAEAVAALAEGLGVFDRVEIATAEVAGSADLGMPAVLATRAARDGRPTVVLYAHHDVQPPGDPARWQSSPFEPTVRGGRLYGRGAADDKAGVMVHLAAIRALAQIAGDDLALGITLFVEGEEEAGSRSFTSFLTDHAEALGGDVIVVADSGNWDATTPGLTVSLRGNARFTLRVRTLDHASHSGMFGGAVPDAMMATIRLLSTLWDADGSVAVDGLRVREAETPAYAERTLRAEVGLPAGVSPIGSGPILGRIWNKPALTVTGIDAPTVANAANTLTPEVSVVVSVRVAPGQSAREAYAAIEAHLRAHAPFGAALSFEDVDLGDGFLVDTDGWAVELARDALARGYGVDPVDIGVGGSIPFIADLAHRFPAAQILVTGVEDPHTRAHSPDESLDIATFRRAIVAEALLLDALDSRPTPVRGGV